MTNKTNCADALDELKRINDLNTQLRQDYDNQLVSLRAQIAGLTDQRNQISIPSRNINDYPKVWSDRYYGCDSVRYDAHRRQCNDLNVYGFGTGSYEWDGSFQKDNTGMLFGINVCLDNYGGCCQTRGECSIKQSYIDNLANNAQTKKDGLNSQISQLTSQIDALQPNYLPVPNIGCCQSIDLSKISATQVNLDNLSQKCSLVQSNITSPQPVPIIPTQTSYLGVFLFIVFILLMLLVGVGVYIFADDLGLGDSASVQI